MKVEIACTNCGASFAADSTKIPEAGVRVRCATCKETLLARLPARSGTADGARPGHQATGRRASKPKASPAESARPQRNPDQRFGGGTCWAFREPERRPVPRRAHRRPGRRLSLPAPRGRSVQAARDPRSDDVPRASGADGYGGRRVGELPVLASAGSAPSRVTAASRGSHDVLGGDGCGAPPPDDWRASGGHLGVEPAEGRLVLPARGHRIHADRLASGRFGHTSERRGRPPSSVGGRCTLTSPQGPRTTIRSSSTVRRGT